MSRGPEAQTDPRVAAIMRYQEAFRAAKPTKRESDAINAVLGRPEVGAVTPKPGPKPRPAPEPAPVPEPALALAQSETSQLRTRKDTPPVKCHYCGKKVNTFAGECFHCGHAQPAKADLKPVQARPEPIPVPAPEPVFVPVPDPEPHPVTVPETPVMSAIATAPSTNGTATPLGSPCPECGNARNPVNNRCYVCRPGGLSKVGGELVPTPPKGAATTAAAKSRKPAALTHLDPEIAAIQGCLDALAGLDADQLGRVLKYVQERIKP